MRLRMKRRLRNNILPGLLTNVIRGLEWEEEGNSVGGLPST